MEFDAIAQPKAPAVRFLLFPAERQARRQAQILGTADQRVIDLLQHHRNRADILAMRVQRIGVARGGPTHAPRIGPQTAQRQPESQRRGP